MTPEQWNKVFERARGLSGAIDPASELFLDAVRQLTSPINEARLDTDNAAARAASKATRITQLEAELATLRR